MKPMNVLIVGVGGQGTLLASRVLGAMATVMGADCKLSEVHGMSQRGGSVVTHVRIGSDIAAAIVSPGEADFVLAFEKLEALRFSYYVKPDGAILVNDQEIMPMPVITGAEEYPSDIYEKIAANGHKYFKIPALELAEKAGNSKAVNIVLIGALAAMNGIPYETAEAAVKAAVPAKFLAVNLLALELGYNYKA